jgi:uncharacterized protein YcbX
MNTRLTVTQLNVYPVKSCRGVPLGTVQLDRWGIRHDRNWMVVDAENRFISQRTQPRLALVEPSIAHDLLILTAPEMPPLELPANGRAGPERTVMVWDDTCRALDQGDGAGEWFTRYLRQPVRLVRIGAGFVRPVKETVYPDGADVAFADAYPLLVLSEASLADLNARLHEPLPMNRFRPNLVVAGCEAFAEDAWKRIRIGEVVFQLVSPCERCAITTVDQSTGIAGKEPLTTLATFRRHGGGVIFGMNAVHQAVGSIRVCDAVTVLA